MSSFTAIINKIAHHERTIDGIRNSYDFGDTPDNIMGRTPAVVHYMPEFTCRPNAHHNQWTNEMSLRSILLVTEKKGRGNTLRFLEPAAFPFGEAWMNKFQSQAVINDLFTATNGLVKVFLAGGRYGAGGEIQWNGVEYIGWVFTWNFKIG